MPAGIGRGHRASLTVTQAARESEGSRSHINHIKARRYGRRHRHAVHASSEHGLSSYCGPCVHVKSIIVMFWNDFHDQFRLPRTGRTLYLQYVYIIHAILQLAMRLAGILSYGFITLHDN